MGRLLIHLQECLRQHALIVVDDIVVHALLAVEVRDKVLPFLGVTQYRVARA